MCVLTMFMSLPLLLSYNIKFLIFPHGLSFLILFYWGLVSVFVVPILLVWQGVGITQLFKSAERRSRSRELICRLLASGVAVISLIIFFIVRSIPS
jgi:hypothetical protein